MHTLRGRLNKNINKIKQAVILAGGKGKRLQPYTRILPKPLFPVGDRPIIEILLRQLVKAGIKEVILAVGYQANLIKVILGDGSQFGLKIRYSLEKSPLGMIKKGLLYNARGCSNSLFPAAIQNKGFCCRIFQRCSVLCR